MIISTVQLHNINDPLPIAQRIGCGKCRRCIGHFQRRQAEQAMEEMLRTWNCMKEKHSNSMSEWKCEFLGDMCRHRGHHELWQQCYCSGEC